MFIRLRENIASIRQKDPAARSAWEVLTCYPGGAPAGKAPPVSQAFAAYGLTSDADDPMSVAIRGLVDEVARQSERINELSAALTRLGSDPKHLGAIYVSGPSENGAPLAPATPMLIGREMR